MKTSLKFRKDIEALRGFAVISVLFYHFNLAILGNTFNNGYIGVDLFFVISGYIITKIILDNNLSSFSLSNFYSRRIKRIIPLIVFVIILTTVSILFIFEYFILKKNINSAFTAILGSSNIYFWLTSTIYQFAEETNLVFLHFWSLSIEMQFYIFFPLLFFFFKENLKLIKILLVAFFCISYFFVIKMYQIHEVFNFYNPLSRMFEFASGSLFFLFEENIKKKTPKKFFNNLYIFGLSLIVFFMIFIAKDGDHPNPESLIFVFGIGLMLIFNDDKKFNFIKDIFSKIGKISYSLYLWHFPLLVIGVNLFFDFNDLKKIILIIICFILSIFSYILVEVKFRGKKTIYSIYLFILLVIFLFFMNLIINNKKESYSKFNLDNFYLADRSQNLLKNKNVFSLRKSKNIFSTNGDSKKFSPQFNSKNKKIKVLIVGDSYSKDLFNIFQTNKNLFNDYEFARYGINLIDLKSHRKQILENSFNFINADFIFYTQRFKNEKDINNLTDLIHITKFHNKKLILSLKRPEFTGNNHKNQSILDLYYLDNKTLNKNILDKYLYKNLSNQKKSKTINKLIKNKVNNDIILFNIYEIICTEENKTCHSIDNDGRKNFYDNGHFTLSGSKYFGEILYKKNIHKKIFD